MEHTTLNNYVRTLIELPESSDPVLSTFVDLTNRYDSLLELAARARAIETTLSPDELVAFQGAWNRVETYLDQDHGSHAGLAVFAREGEDPFFLALEFQVPLPTELSVDSVPSIYRLVELKDTYDRYVVLISNAREARILEVSLGAVTRQMWAERPELRKRIGREWTKQHYQNHRASRTDQFVKEKISIIEDVMRSGGHSHLIIAGHPAMTARVRRELPRQLEEKLIDLVSIEAKGSKRDIVEATLDAFVQDEKRRSIGFVTLVEQALSSGSGLAVAGPEATHEVLRSGQADVLVLDSGYGVDLGDLRDRELFTRLAEQHGCRIEIVSSGGPLRKHGGVACLLRYPLQREEAWVAPASMEQGATL